MTRNYDAFTLAEVLITLVIVGIIAAMTIPTLINKTNKQEYVVRLKKTYSTLAQATNRIIAEEGTPKASVGGWATSHEAIFNMYKKYLSKAKECLVGQSCFDLIDYKYMDGSSANYNFMNSTGMGRLVLADGTFVNFNMWRQNCDGGQVSDELGKVCAYIHVDLNGAKGPNVFGRDAFRFYLTENGLFPSGCDYDSSNCKTGHYGQACCCVVIKEGAINY